MSDQICVIFDSQAFKALLLRQAIKWTLFGSCEYASRLFGTPTGCNVFSIDYEMLAESGWKLNAKELKSHDISSASDTIWVKFLPHWAHIFYQYNILLFVIFGICLATFRFVFAWHIFYCILCNKPSIVLQEIWWRHQWFIIFKVSLKLHEYNTKT